MGRKAGVSVEETRTELLGAAARVFASKGYEGAGIADICKEAGLSTGPVYAHFGSKAELFVAVLEEHGREQFRRIVPADGSGDVADFLVAAGSTIDQRAPEMSRLVIEAIVAAGRDHEVAKLVRSWLSANEELLAASISVAQQDGTIADDVDAATISRLVTIVALGSHLAGASGAAPPDHDDWGRLITRLIDAFRVQR